MNTKIEIKKNQKIQDPRMDDSGEFYFATFQYRDRADIELYGENEWRTGKIIWETTHEWKAEGERVEAQMKENPDARIEYGILDDESVACDWSEYEIQDENGVTVSESASKQVSELL